LLFKSLFLKQFILYIGTLLISFTLLAVAASQAFNNYFISRRIELLEQQAQSIVEILLEPFGRTSSMFSTFTVQQRMSDHIAWIQGYMDASVLFLDVDFRVFLATSDMRQFEGMTLVYEHLEPVLDGQVVAFQGLLTDMFPTRMLTVAYPIILNNQVAGAVLLNTSIPELEQTTSDIVRITVMSMVMTGIFSFVFIYFSSRTIVRPLLAMNEAAKVIAGGDFEKRIEVRTRDEVGQLGESFNNMAESLAQQDRLRREFLVNVSHDLRTPLTSMRGFLQAMLDGTAPPNKTQRYLGIVLEETERLSEMANDILDLNSLHGEDLSLTCIEFDINELIRKTASAFESRVAERELFFDMNLNAVGNTLADYEKIQRVIYNLIDNALKFTPPGGMIIIETKTSGKELFVKIKDTGCGISPMQQKRVFDRFYKADEARSASGSGLGLSIVQAFVKAHGGDITLKSEAGEGSEFVFSLPLV
jgi:signal transduction histidine kinase